MDPNAKLRLGDQQGAVGFSEKTHPQLRLKKQAGRYAQRKKAVNQASEQGSSTETQLEQMGSNHGK